jgi:DNA ligase (NAD+)
LQRSKVGVGTIVRIIKSGKIIPKIIGVISKHTTPDYPKHCPACNHATTVVKGGGDDMVELMCLNVSCGARAVNTIAHYLSTLGVKGVAESTIQKLYNAKLAKNPADLYDLTSDQLKKLDFGDRNSRLAIARIHMIDQAEKIDDNDLDAAIDKAVKAKKKVQAWQFFASLGIEGSGKTAGKALINHFGSFDAIRKASVKDLSEVDGIGEKSAEVINLFFEENSGLLDRLLKHVELELPKTGKLSQFTFCFTGGFDQGKSHWEKAVENLGGKVSSSVSKKVNYVVVGTDAGSKEQKADDLGIKKLTLDDLKKML